MTINPAEHQEQQEALTGPERPDPALTQVDYTCPHCGSREIAVDSTAIWNVNGPYFEIRGTDGPWMCDECGEEFNTATSIDLNA